LQTRHASNGHANDRFDLEHGTLIMFERNRVDNSGNSAHQTAVPAEIVLMDGEVPTC
jgi:hypothetical protein